MTRVYGLLFEDHRSGILAIQPSVPFFGCERYEQHYDVVDGAVDFDLLPTPAGVFYNVGFKRLGDTRRTDFTLRWTIPNYGEIDITPNGQAHAPEPEKVSTSVDRVQVRRLATELAEALELAEKQEREIAEIKLREEQLRQKFEQHKRDMETVLVQRDQHIAKLAEANTPEVRTVVKHVPVPPAPLEERINTLELENQRLRALNDNYYQSVLKLHQLKLERAQSGQLPDPVMDVPGTPQQRLINKLLAK
jgi:hypothetical protein